MARVCVVGAGAAGLCAARHLLAEPCVSSVDVLEQATQLGGTWVYTENVGYDDFGLPIHTSMYKSLRTNLPKEIMGFPDYPIPESDKSYLPAKDMLAFLQSYADKHGVTELIKFHNHVQLIIPKQGPSGELWDVTSKDLTNGATETKEYDYVFVCNGHYNTPFIPSIPGLKEFNGDVMHSHDYRVPEIFTGQRVLVIGAGPSGMDIALEITSVTKKVVLSHHHNPQPRTKFPDNLVQRPDVVRLSGNHVYFQDGSEEEVDVVFLCTGYQYNFPFLHPSCGIVVEDNCVEPLYKHLVNIQHPTMCFIGVPYYVCAFSMFDLQVRYYVRSMNGTFALPDRDQMAAHWEGEKRERAARGYSKRQAHMMGPDQFHNHVQLIIPKQGPSGELWDVTSKDLTNGATETKEYDYVFVCNGHYNTPFIPSIPGLKEFNGDVMHSHDYRVPEIFTGQRVLVIGAGPSGMDIALEITSVTKKVVLSHHHNPQPRTKFPDNLVQRPDVVRLSGNHVYFQDGSEEEVDVVFLCTGYQYNFPFLHPSCGIVVEDNCVEPLYKHLVNIQHPTMCFIGVPYYVCAFSMFDLQVRYYVRSMNGTFALPDRDQMAAHWEGEKRERAARGYSKRQAHMMGPDQGNYYITLSQESGEESLPPVFTKVHNDCGEKFKDNLTHYRTERYRIIDEDNFICY